MGRVTHPFRAAVEAGDHAATVAALAPGAVFHSPAVFRPYEGRDAVGRVLDAVTRVFEDFRYVEEITGPDSTVLVFRARVGDRELEGIDLVRPAAGPVEDLTVLIRPLSALQAVVAAMGRELGTPPAGDGRG